MRRGVRVRPVGQRVPSHPYPVSLRPPFRRRRTARVARATAQVDQATASAGEAIRDVLREASVSLYQALYDAERIRLLTSAEELAYRVFRSADRRYRSGDLPVIERRAVNGQMLEPGTPAFRVANLSTLWLTVHAFERDAVRIQPGAVARVTFSALPGQTFDGPVMLIGRQVASESRTVDVRIEISNRDGLLRTGMSASAAVPVAASKNPYSRCPCPCPWPRSSGSWSGRACSYRKRPIASRFGRSGVAVILEPKSRSSPASPRARPS